MFNQENTTWKGGNYSLFFGEDPALHDSVNTTHPELFKLYKRQKALDWSEDEVNLEQSRIDMDLCPVEVRDLMLENLALQWEADSIASRSIAPLFAPFITNSELWAAWLKISEIEVLHALTYSEIVRQCIRNPNEIFEKIMGNEKIIGRLNTISKTFSKLRKSGAERILGEHKDSHYDDVMTAVTALYAFERLQFIISFAATFAVVDSGWFQGIGKLVQKIAQEERFIHAEVDKYVIVHELSTERGKRWFKENIDTIKAIIDEVREAEFKWNDHIFSEGRRCVGQNKDLMAEAIDYHAQELYNTFGFTPPVVVKKNPLPYMDNWFDMNKNQNAMQEADGMNYLLNIIVDDIPDDYDFGFSFKGE